MSDKKVTEETSFFGSIIKGIGGAARDLVEVADSTYEVTKDAIVDTAEGIADIPKLLGEGYDDGFISNGDNAKEETPEVKTKPLPKEGEPGFVAPKQD